MARHGLIEALVAALLRQLCLVAVQRGLLHITDRKSCWPHQAKRNHLGRTDLSQGFRTQPMSEGCGRTALAGVRCAFAVVRPEASKLRHACARQAPPAPQRGLEAGSITFPQATRAAPRVRFEPGPPSLRQGACQAACRRQALASYQAHRSRQIP